MQSVRLLAFIWASALAAPAAADPAPQTYRPWSGPGPYRRAEAALRRDAPPRPLVAPAENGRRPFELAFGFGLGLPRCSDGSVDAEQCALLGSGFGGDLIALYRVTPYFAFGGDVGLNRFGPRESRAESLLGGILGRVYFLGEGLLDPHLELMLGAGSFTVQAQGLERTASGPVARVGAGIDFSIGPGVRLGPALDLTTYLVDTVRRCQAGGACLEQSLAGHAHPTSFASLSVRLAIAFGKPM